MKKIEITMERTVRRAEEFEVPDSVYDEIVRTNRIPDNYFDKMADIVKESQEADVEYDYAVYDIDNEKEIIEWG